MLLKHSLRVLLSGHRVSSGSLLNSPLRLSHQGSRQIPGHLDVVSTNELLHEGMGPSRPTHKAIITTPHWAGESMTCRRATKTPKGRHSEIQLVVHLRTSTQGSNVLLSHSLELILTLTFSELVLNLTLLKLVLNLTLSKLVQNLSTWSMSFGWLRELL
jgi:hypothetical protein